MERTGIEPVTSGLQTRPIARPHLTTTYRIRMSEPKIGVRTDVARHDATEPARTALARPLSD